MNSQQTTIRCFVLDTVLLHKSGCKEIIGALYSYLAKKIGLHVDFVLIPSGSFLLKVTNHSEPQYTDPQYIDLETPSKFWSKRLSTYGWSHCN